MKRIIVILFSALLAFGGVQVADAATKAKPKAKTETVVFSSNIHCANCAKKIEENIAFEKGVKGLEVSVENKTVTVTFDPSKTDTVTLKAAIEKLGYAAKIKH
ncbi:MAG: heavy-metal-associated domain-containing protein [Bacteroidales bacterium]|nr:heavy-metal-associated domain-containing protein [Bacteroidales bacterium]